jgi:hypothetical protein
MDNRPHKLNPFIKKLSVAQIIKNSPTFRGTRRFIALHTKTLNLSQMKVAYATYLRPVLILSPSTYV